MTGLLPPNATASERAIEGATDRAIVVPIASLWNPETCPASVLPWLAWALSVEIHRHKGTVWAMQRALQVAGLGDATISEGWSANLYDGGFSFDGSRQYAQSDHCAEYRVTLARPLSIRQAEQARAILTAAAPVRCHLKLMTFEQAANPYNGAIY